MLTKKGLKTKTWSLVCLFSRFFLNQNEDWRLFIEISGQNDQFCTAVILEFSLVNCACFNVNRIIRLGWLYCSWRLQFLQYSLLYLPNSLLTFILDLVFLWTDFKQQDERSCKLSNPLHTGFSQVSSL